ncbi:hypothetical protein [Vibrio mexicanus]|uniref:hypothetical protein n=1 Tax=Vibrio mexicanus TaxID=1004326 RepID=UPI00063C9719|nr:hypothetical protein [Vibrio mexicanus]
MTLNDGECGRRDDQFGDSRYLLLAEQVAQAMLVSDEPRAKTNPAAVPFSSTEQTKIVNAFP